MPRLSIPEIQAIRILPSVSRSYPIQSLADYHKVDYDYAYQVVDYLVGSRTHSACSSWGTSHLNTNRTAFREDANTLIGAGVILSNSLRS